jgi:hypothetical protein
MIIRYPPFSLHISGGGDGGEDVVKVPALYPGEYSIHAGLILRQVYVPEKVTQIDHKIPI